MSGYNNFEEMDQDLKYLRLQQQVHRETIKLQINEVRKSLSVVSLVANVIGSFTKKRVVTKLVKRFLGSKK
jgi:hypothetical protein